MTTVLSRSDNRQSIGYMSSRVSSSSSARELRGQMVAVRVSFTWLGIRKTLTPQQKAEAAESFGASQDFLSAGKKLLDTKHPSFRTVTMIKGKILGYWKAMTLPFPNPGVRLIPQGKVEEFHDAMRHFSQELQQAVLTLDEHYGTLKASARERLGSLYNDADYPASLQGWFDVDWDFPSIDAPTYLQELNPELYREERRRVQARFEEAVQLAEQAFTEEFSRLVNHLCERISGQDGERKVFRDSAVNNLREFFERFRNLNVHSSAELDALVERAQRAVQGIEPADLRTSQDLRTQLRSDLSQVQHSLDQLLVDRPRRRILRPQRTSTQA